MGLKGRGCKSGGRSKSTPTVIESSKSIGQESSDTGTSSQSSGPKSSQLNLSAGDSPVNQSQSQEREKETRTTDGSGPSSFEPFARYDLGTHSWRMYQGCSQLTTGDLPDEFSGTWPRRGMIRNGIAYRPKMSEPPISDDGCSLLPTPRAIYGAHPGMKDPSHLTGAVHLWATPSAADAVGSHGGGQGRSLRTDIAHWKKGRWRTPMACDYKNMSCASQQYLSNQVRWPTPTQTDAKGRSYSYDRGDHEKPRLSLTGVAQTFPTPNARDCSRNTSPKRDRLPDIVASSNSGQLNPTWVEWLMGFPLGWTDLSASETQSFPKSPSTLANPSSKRKKGGTMVTGKVVKDVRVPKD